MDFSHRHYVPCLRWKKGEYDAVGQLSAKALAAITPLIEVPEIGYDFARKRPSKSVDDHLAPFAQRVRQKWDSRDAFVDARHIADYASMADGKHPLEFVLDKLRREGCSAVPVTDPTRDVAHQRAVRRAAARDRRGVCIRVGVQFAASPTVGTEIDRLLAALRVTPAQADLILDLGAPNYDPVSGFSLAILSIIGRLPHLAEWRTFTLLGTAFPSSMGEVKRGVTRIPRSEWPLYKAVVASLGARGERMPAFGDYTINHPELLPMDMRLLKPSATIRYAIDDEWLMVKGTTVRKKNGYEQFHTHSATVVASGYFMGAGFSSGDTYIADCAVRRTGKGNLTTWRKVGTNHHLEVVARDVASLSYP